MRTLRIVGALLRASLLTGLQYRADFVLDGLTGVLRALATIAPLWLVFEHREAVMGWTLEDTTLVLGLFLLLQALLQGLVEPNLGAVVEAVRTGSFDLVLLRPADSQLLVSLQRVAPAHVWDLAAALGLCGWALAQRPPSSALDVAVALLMLVCGAAGMYGLWLLAVSAAFIFVRVDNLRHLLGAVVDAGRWPIPVFSGWVRWVLTVGVPVALFTSFPAMALRGTWDLALVATGVAVGGGFAIVSRWVWVASLARYTSASS